MSSVRREMAPAPQEGTGPLNIMVVLLYWYPYHGPMTPIYGEMFRELKRRGHRVTIVSSFPHFRSGSKETFEEYRGKLYEKTEWEGIDLIRTWVFAPIFSNPRIGLLCRAGNYLSFSLSSLLAGALLRRKVDIVMTLSSPPLINGLVGWAISRTKNAESIHHIVDIYPEIAEKMGVWTNPLTMLPMKALERMVYAVSDSIVVLSENMRENLLGKGVPPRKLDVLPIFADFDGLYPQPRDNEFAREYGLVDPTVVLYAGNIGVHHGVEVLVETATLMQDRPDVKFCIVGRGEWKHTIVEMAKKRGLSNIVFPERQPEHKVPLIWASGDICAITYRKGLSEYSLPSKMLNIMGAGKPVLLTADRTADSRRIVEETECGVAVDCDDPEALKAAIETLANNPPLRQEMGERGRRHALETYECSAVVDGFEALFRRLARSRG